VNFNDDIVPTSWSLDDQQVLSTYQLANGGSDLVLAPATGGKAVPFVATKYAETNGQFSPDGKWVAYASNESGDWEIYVTNYPAARASGRFRAAAVPNRAGVETAKKSSISDLKER